MGEISATVRAMKSRILSASVVLLVLVGLACGAWAAQVDYFLKIPGVDGESTDAGHKNEIEILSWSWGESNSSTVVGGGGTGTGKVTMQDFHFVKKMDKATPKLMLACATGQHIAQAVLSVRRPSSDPGGNPVEYLKVTFTDLLVRSYQTGGSSGDVIPTETLSLNFAAIKFEYTPYDPATGEAQAPVVFEYDLRTGGL